MIELSPDAQKVMGVGLAFAILSSAAVILRLLTKKETKASFASDDWWIIAALAIFYVTVGLEIRAIYTGGGTFFDHLRVDQEPSVLTQQQKLLYIGEICYNSTITCAKLSILAFYRRIFPIRGFRITSFVVDALCIAWFLIVTFITIFQCKPTKTAFNGVLDLTSSCIPLAAFNFGLEFTNATLDIVILCLPINMTRNLHMPVRQRIVLSCIFLLGGFVIVTSILRMALIYHPASDEKVSPLLGVTLGLTQEGLAIICACLPTLRPLLKGSATLTRFTNWYKSYVSSKRGLRRSRQSYDPQASGQGDLPAYDRLGERGIDRVHLTKVTGGSISEGDMNNVGGDYPLNTITVRRSLEVV